MIILELVRMPPDPEIAVFLLGSAGRRYRVIDNDDGGRSPAQMADHWQQVALELHLGFSMNALTTMAVVDSRGADKNWTMTLKYWMARQEVENP